jgi:hypothetical protein
MPVKPPVLAPSAYERTIKMFQGMRGRPRFVGSMLAGHESAVGIAACKIKGKRIGEDGVVLYWMPTGKQEEEQHGQAADVR